MFNYGRCYVLNYFSFFVNVTTTFAILSEKVVASTCACWSSWIPGSTSLTNTVGSCRRGESVSRITTEGNQIALGKQPIGSLRRPSQPPIDRSGI